MNRKRKTEKLKEYCKYLGIAHLNAQSTYSIFNEFDVVINENQFDVVTLSKTWFHDNTHLLDKVKIRGYKSV